MNLKQSGLLARRFKRKLGLLCIPEQTKAVTMTYIKTPDTS